MAGSRRSIINIVGGGDVTRGIMSRPIPRRGRVKVAIVAGLAHQLASMFTIHVRCAVLIFCRRIVSSRQMSSSLNDSD
ncbi:hypothetical protein NL676_007996 [Syzygium grande]|nr:hypothetical protein NL676_007996 [Syzygium grande]